MAMSLLAPTVATAEAQGKNGGLGRPDLPEHRVSNVKAVEGLAAEQARAQVSKDRKANEKQAAKAKAEQNVAWPRAGQGTLNFDTSGKDSVKPGGLPVTIDVAKGDPESGRITVLSRKKAEQVGVDGVLLTAEVADAGTARIEIDYGEFAGAYGGGWPNRLRLVTLPSCVLTTPEKEQCRKITELDSRNNVSERSVSADVSLDASKQGQVAQLGGSGDVTVLALTSSATSTSASGESPAGSGDYSATPLAESASWEAGSSSGAFTWSYDFTMPPAAAGPTPALSLAYDSGSVDGRTATTNNQGTAVGEGFSLTESYIERSYVACDDDGHDDVYDRCWKYDNAQLVLNGQANRLVKDDDSGAWHLANDDASKVTRHTGADNGDDNGEYWTVVTGDGTKYVFGLHKLDGAGEQRTNSTWTVPVFGDDAGEPGYSNGGAFKDRSLTQAWRWNLDYVEDTHGNAMTYWYAKETNHYRKNKAETANASYVRGGYLKEIRYGQRAGALFTDDPDAKVTFSHAERCTVGDCAELTEDTAKNWPDVPFDAMCSSGDSSTDCSATGPAFFSRKRVTGISTFSWSAPDGSYDPVDSWTLKQDYLDGGDIGDTTDHVLVLKSLERTGKTGTAVSVNPVTFTYQMRPNRVDATDDILPLTRPRVSTVTSETGAITTVTLSNPECRRSEVIDAAEDTNTRNCYPQYWHINGAQEASVDWFHKYRVLAVTVSDPTGHNEAVEHAYSYSGAAWRHNDDPLISADERTWSNWRGYRQVTAYTGAESTTRSRVTSVYYQGKDGDKRADGSTRSVDLPPLASPALGIPTVADSAAYVGRLRQQVTYNGSTPISVVVNDPWSRETARQDVPSAADQVARYVRTERTATHTHLTAAQSWWERAQTTSFDDHGMPVKVSDSGEVGKSGDETCTRTWYARNASRGITSLPSRTRTVGKACSVSETGLSLPLTTATRGDVLADVAMVYDDPEATAWAPGQKPTKGAVTWTGRATGYSAIIGLDGERDVTGWQTTKRVTHDALGRVVSATDAAGNTGTTAYTPTSSGPLTRTVTTNAKGHKEYVFLDPRRGLPLRTYDANMKKTEQTYDALGRLTAVWLPNRSKGAGYSANLKFGYHLSSTQPSAISTSSLQADGSSYTTSYEIYDALLRPLQTQKPTPVGGRLLTDTRYDSRGLAYETYADIFDSTATPNQTYTRAEYGEAPKQTAVAFDGAGRETSSSLYTYGEKRWSTVTTYTGDSSATTALDGGSARRTITDALGRTTEIREYSSESPADSAYGTGPGVAYTSTKFIHFLDGQQATITGPDGATWTYFYDLFGRQTVSNDPDKGEVKTEFDALDQAIKVTDARGDVIHTAYDELGRATGTWSGTKTDANQLTSQTYDTVLKGHISASTRYLGGKNGQAYTKEVTEYDSLNRPITRQLHLPTSDPLVMAGSPSTLTFESHYSIDGNLKSATEPALGGLAAESVEYDYTDLGQVQGVGGATGYLLHADYSAKGQLQQLTLGTANTEAHKKAYVTNTYEEGTGRLLRSHVTDQTHPYMLQDLNYRFDDAGNVTSIADPTHLGNTSAAETQCFAYDGYRRLTHAWTPTSQDCQAERSATSLTGPAPYWTSYTYNDAGLRTSETQHKVGGSEKTTYCYEGDQPHALSGTSTTADCSTPERSYAYDVTGNTTGRPGETAAQELSWSEEGQLTKLTEGDTSTDYIYDADGTLLVRDTENGERVLYAGATELHLRANGDTWAQRYYRAGDLTVAVRSNESGEQKVSYLAGDHHGTSSLAIDSETQDFAKRYMTPFGAERTGGAVGAWIDDKGFLGKTTDKSTGLTHVEAREYDVNTGMFISVDPLLEIDKPQTLNGYSYSINNPLTFSDPTGEGLACGFNGLPACPTRPDGSRGNGRPNEAVDYSKPIPPHPCNSNCGGGGRGTHPEGSVVDVTKEKFFGESLDDDTYEFLRDMGYKGSRSFTIAEAAELALSEDSGTAYTTLCRMQGRDPLSCQADMVEAFAGDSFIKRHKRDLVAGGILVAGGVAAAFCPATAGMTCPIAAGAVSGAGAYAATSAGTENWSTGKFVIYGVAGGATNGAGAYLVSLVKNGKTVSAARVTSLEGRHIQLQLEVTQMELTTVRMVEYARKQGIVE
ncbi:RHS repeat-associated core domain-containing protein [Streptomyces sp. JJ38]|uniref:RHS repeat domain-containing protein n=1 Tax=Streptomyces sp. JJ38 TaxID=2738128 RepID=UPI001C58C131|nr:RHS repeat-associated core domain-containing protein [Streptomyces sp. JJ38]MBW1596957.1 RHS repeat-associated core domain-containing protein [Streptomyces sp. JJ38]